MFPSCTYIHHSYSLTITQLEAFPLLCSAWKDSLTELLSYQDTSTFCFIKIRFIKWQISKVEENITRTTPLCTQNHERKSRLQRSNSLFICNFENQSAIPIATITVAIDRSPRTVFQKKRIDPVAIFRIACSFSKIELGTARTNSADIIEFKDILGLFDQLAQWLSVNLSPSSWSRGDSAESEAGQGRGDQESNGSS